MPQYKSDETHIKQLIGKHEKNVSYSSPQTQIDEECPTESVEDLRRRLNSMKQLMNERNNTAAQILNGDTIASTRNCSVIDDKFLSVIFMFVLCIIITVSAYAFYNLYTAIVKKFTPRHDEL